MAVESSACPVGTFARMRFAQAAAAGPGNSLKHTTEPFNRGRTTESVGYFQVNQRVGRAPGTRVRRFRGLPRSRRRKQPCRVGPAPTSAAWLMDGRHGGGCGGSAPLGHGAPENTRRLAPGGEVILSTVRISARRRNPPALRARPGGRLREHGHRARANELLPASARTCQDHLQIRARLRSRGPSPERIKTTMASTRIGGKALSASIYCFSSAAGR